LFPRSIAHLWANFFFGLNKRTAEEEDKTTLKNFSGIRLQTKSQNIGL